MGNNIKIYKESPKSLEGPRHCDLWNVRWKWMESMEIHGDQMWLEHPVRVDRIHSTWVGSKSLTGQIDQLLVGPLSMGAPILMQIHPTFRPLGPDLQDSYPGQGRGHSAGVSFHKGTTARRCDQFKKWNVWHIWSILKPSTIIYPHLEIHRKSQHVQGLWFPFGRDAGWTCRAAL